MNFLHRLESSLILGIFLALLMGCGGGEDGNGVGGSASLSWEPVNNPTVVSYTVHFGRQSTGEDGSCNYESSLEVYEPFATVTGLEPNTLYYFAVSAYNGHRSRCSNEVSKLIPDSQM